VIQEVTIRNFKSVQDLTIPLSRFNIFIGSNGSGKSNILEAIAFGAAAAAAKLDHEFLSSRGIRAAEARLMKSAFAAMNLFSIEIGFKADDNEIVYTLTDIDTPLKKWVITALKIQDELIEVLKGSLDKNDIEAVDDFLFKNINYKYFNYDNIRNIVSHLPPDSVIDIVKLIMANQYLDSNYLSNFIIYSPEISSLRKFEEESQIQPLGIKGEGLFNVLQIFNENYGEETIEELKDFLHIIEWFKDFETVDDPATGRKSLIVKDRYIADTSLNQHNVNEGFLFLLFYISLIVSKETPGFFAIDNIEASFHPRLCEELTRRLVELCKKHDKQIIITTHNPAVLDGLNLDDPEQALFVIRRNADGETIADKIDQQPKNVKLSEAWERGYIGGQPETIA
jgi:predicted ATPase